MGEVFLAQQTGPAGFSRLAVVKRILPAQEFDQTAQELFLDEARIAAQLTHPNIVQVYDLGEAEHSYFIAMEYVRGVTVGTLIRGLRKQQQVLDPVVAVTIAIGALRGLHYAHTLTDEAGVPLHIVHRDISPENLMVTREGVTKVLDFGIAKASTRSTRTVEGMVRGKMAYLSPEQLLGENVDARCDIRAIGVVLCEMLSGARYVDPNLEMPQFTRFIIEEPVPTFGRYPQIAQDLAGLIDPALRRFPHDRYPTAEAFADALDAWKRQAPPVPTSSLTSLVQTFESVAEASLRSPSVPSQRMSNQALTTPNSKTVEKLESKDIVHATPHPPQKKKKPLLALGVAVGVLVAIIAGALGSSLLRRRTPPPPPIRSEPITQPSDSSPIDPQASVVTPPPKTTEAVPDASVVSSKTPEPPGDPRKTKSKPGMLDLRVSPWAIVSIDGKVIGETPIAPLELTPGVHLVVLTNPELQVRKDVSVRISSGQRTDLKINLLE
jgi:serine/threonine-protein kinase